MTYSCLPSLAIYVYDLQLSLTYRYVPSLAVHVFDLQLSTFSCSWNPSSKWDSSQTECFCWLLWGHLWGRCWSSTSHRCRPSSRQRRCMLQVCTAVSVDHELWAFWGKKSKNFCELCLCPSLVCIHLCLHPLHFMFTPSSVYRHYCLHPLCFVFTHSSVFIHNCSHSVLFMFQFISVYTNSTPYSVCTQLSSMVISKSDWWVLIKGLGVKGGGGGGEPFSQKWILSFFGPIFDHSVHWNW